MIFNKSTKLLYLNYIRHESILSLVLLKLNKGVRTGNTVVLDFCIPITISLNYKNIYMIGCDFNYSKNSNRYFYGKPVSNQNLHESIDRDKWIEDVRLAFKIISSSEISNANFYNFNSESTNDIIPNYNLNEIYNI